MTPTVRPLEHERRSKQKNLVGDANFRFNPSRQSTCSLARTIRTASAGHDCDGRQTHQQSVALNFPNTNAFISYSKPSYERSLALGKQKQKPRLEPCRTGFRVSWRWIITYLGKSGRASRTRLAGRCPSFDGNQIQLGGGSLNSRRRSMRSTRRRRSSTSDLPE